MADVKTDRRQALELALASIDRQFGKGAIMRLGQGGVFDERRWRRETTLELRQAVARAGSLPFASVPITAVSLMRSDLSPSGARYTELAAVALGPR